MTLKNKFWRWIAEFYDAMMLLADLDSTAPGNRHKLIEEHFARKYGRKK